MFAVIYSFQVKPGREGEFEAAWAERTGEIASSCGGWGSRLHLSDDGLYVAYAQWPSRQDWENCSVGAATIAGKVMAGTIESVSVVCKMDLVHDMLQPISVN